MSEQYGALARVYDELMYDAGYGEWADYLLGLLRESGIGRGCRVLEYACGTGNLTLPLARGGYRVTAVDVSEDMLMEAQQKARKGALAIDFACADMCGFVMNKPVSAAICACDGVNYILEEDRLERFLRNTCGHLEEGGVFLFDISSEYKLARVLGNEFYYDDADEQTYFWQNTYDEARALLKMDITLFTACGEVYQRFDETHVQRAWKTDQLLKMLTAAGFTDCAAYAFLTSNAPEGCEHRIQFVAHKRGGKRENNQ